MMIERSPYPRMAAALLALLGLFDAAYLSLERFTGGSLVCPVGGGCEAVQNSAYATIAGTPVAFIGVAGYAVLLLVALLALNTDQVVGVRLPTLLLGLASAGVLFAIYLSVVQVAVLQQICFWCVVSALLEVGIWIAALVDWRMRRAILAHAVAAPAPRSGGARPAQHS